MKRNSSCLLVVLIILCAISALGVGALVRIPAKAEAIFGPSAPHLDASQKLLLSWRLLQNETELLSPANPFQSETAFKIEMGESPNSVARRLETEGLIRDAHALLNFMIYAGLDTRIQAGDYKVNPATSAIDIAYTLLDATPTEVPFAVLAGWRLEEIAASLPNSGLEISPESFIEEAQTRNLEGYLLPGIYTVPRSISVTNLLDILTSAFENTITAEIKAGFTKQGLSTDEAVRLASIVEREAIVDNERPLIASVFLNRLAIGMKLEADPTVQYAVGYNFDQATWWTNPLSQADLETDSAYNSYLYPGLPPSPICNPSLDALRAVAFPAQTPYYYFRAACDGSGQHNFAETYNEHLGNACP